MKRALLALGMIAACSHDKPAEPPKAELAPSTPMEKLLAMLPPGAQVVIELDLARLRANPAIGAVVTEALAVRANDKDAGAPLGVPASPLADADQLVLAAYAVGTAQAATLTVMTSPHEVGGTTKLLDGFYALGPPDWIEQVQQRVTLASTGESKFAIHAAPELLELRDHAMPPGAPGAALRVTARLSFDARVALARQTGLDSAPAQISAWGDVVDDLALVVDCDSADPGNQAKTGRPSDAPKRLEATLRGALAAVADQPAMKLLGLPGSLNNAKLVTRGTWVRTIVAVGPSHLHRVIERATSLLKLAEPAPAPASSPSSSSPHGEHSS